MIYALIVVLVLGAFAATLGREGLWSGVLATVNAVIAGIVATAFYEPAAQFMQELMFGATFYVDFFCLAAIFGVTFGILRSITDNIARRQLHFPPLVNQIGGVVAAVVCGWVTVSFLSMGLHMAPLEPQPLFGSFQAKQSNFLGVLAPDYQWMHFFGLVSTGALAPLDEQAAEIRFFDESPDEVVDVYLQRRQNFGTPTVGPGQVVRPPAN